MPRVILTRVNIFREWIVVFTRFGIQGSIDRAGTCLRVGFRKGS